MDIYIFGAKSIAIGVSRAIRTLKQEMNILGFLVSSLENNPEELDGVPVRELGKVSAEMDEREKRNVCVYIAVPEFLHKEIIYDLLEHGFVNYRAVDSGTEAKLMEKYFSRIKKFPSLHELPLGKEKAELTIYLAQFYKDKILEAPPALPDYVSSVLLGCSRNEDKELEKNADFCDNVGEQISSRNPDYCEMTAFYWVWKNRMTVVKDYVGICHYRRILDITEEDRQRMLENDVDVVLPFPMIHLPDICEHHTRYIREEEWQIMLQALKELYPDYADAYESIFSGSYFYNYNLVIAKKAVFENYCAWVFPLLIRTEELCIMKKIKRSARYLAYISESLLAFYFLYHKELRIYHTGRLLFT